MSKHSKKLISALILLSLLFGCSTTPMNNKTDWDSVNADLGDEKVPEIDFNSKFRSISAEDKELPNRFKATNESDFKLVMSSKNQDQLFLRLQIRLDAVEEVFFRAKDALNEFDVELNTSYDRQENISDFFGRIIKSGLYSRILALRENNLFRQNQVLSLISKFDDVIKNPKSSSNDVSNAKKSLIYIGKYYTQLPRTYLVAHYFIAVQMNKISFRDDKIEKGLARALGVKKKSDEISVENFNNYKDLYLVNSVESGVNRIAELFRTKDSTIDRDVKKDAQYIQYGLEKMLSDKSREPNSVKVLPSAGPMGNITGGAFPKGVWSLTFDDGPHAVYTKQVEQNLIDTGMKATFFMLSKNVLLYPDVAKSLQRNGMEMANHSHDHQQLTKLNNSQLDFEITGSTDKIESVLGERTKYFRCPYGAGTNVPRIREKIAKENMVHVFWNVDSLDWQDRNPATIVGRVKKEMALAKNQGGIILFHDIHPQSVIASKEIMKILTNQSPGPGYEIAPKTIGEAVDLVNGK